MRRKQPREMILRTAAFSVTGKINVKLSEEE